MPCAGLIGWVPNTDTLHALIREFRDVRKIPLNIEHRMMLGMAPDFDHLMVIEKVEVFQHALESTSGTRQLYIIEACPKLKSVGFAAAAAAQLSHLGRRRKCVLISEYS